MLDLLSLFSLALFAAAAAGSLWTLPRMRRIGRMELSTVRAEASDEAPEMPSVTIVVAAKDEEATLEPALRSLLDQVTEGVRVVAVNDRSDNDTGAIMERVAAERPGLTVLHIKELPAGWLGKNHALQRGAQVAASHGPGFLLFTDADVVFEPGGALAAARFAQREGLEHLAGGPKVHAASWALGGQVAAFGMLFGLFTRPWSVPDPKSSAYVGIGALNLVRRSSYEAAGGHGSVRMRIDDDLRLGQHLKRSGARSAFAFARDVASLTWYPTLGAMLKGLHKNAFAGIDFSMLKVCGATAVLAGGFLGPYALLLAPGVDPIARAASAATIALHTYGAAESASSAGLPRRCAFFFPAGIALFLGVLWRSALGALWTGKIVWRGTTYSLKELRKAAASR